MHVTHLVFELRPGAYNTETLIEFLTFLHQLEQHRSVLLLWDGLPAHRSRCMLEWVASQRDWLSIEPLPGYAPDVSPDRTGVGQSEVQGARQPVLGHHRRNRRRCPRRPEPHW